MFEIPVFNANSVDPNNEPSHLDLRCVTFSLSILHNLFPSDSFLLFFFKKQTNVI